VVEENELVSRPAAEGKKKIPGEGGGCFGLDRFRVRFSPFFVLPLPNYKMPPLKIQCRMVFIGKVLLGFQISPSTFPFLLFSFFFCKF
jgi:hypothetical protein